MRQGRKTAEDIVAAHRDELRALMSVLGKSRSPKKLAALAENRRKPRPNQAKRTKPILSYPCTCGKGDTLEGHPTTCPRGRAIWRRKRQNKPLT